MFFNNESIKDLIGRETGLQHIFDIEHLIAISLYNQAKSNGCIDLLQYRKNTETYEKEFVLLDKSKNWNRTINIEGHNHELSRFVNYPAETGMTGFFIGDFNLNYLIFVVSENTPKEFRKYIAFHEDIESSLVEVPNLDIAYIIASDKTLDPELIEKSLEEDRDFAMRYPHREACTAVISQVFYKGEEFSSRYANWLMKSNGNPDDQETFFHQAIPGFISGERINKNPLNTLVEFYYELNLFISTPDKLVENWGWIKPYAAGCSRKHLIQE